MGQKLWQRLLVLYLMLFVVFFAAVVALGRRMGPLELLVLVITLGAIGVWQTRRLRRAPV